MFCKILCNIEFPDVNVECPLSQCRNGAFDHVSILDLDKYLSRGLEKMPWIEMSQSEFLMFVVNARVLREEVGKITHQMSIETIFGHK